MSTTLTTGLVEFWKLDEASGTRNGSLGAFNLSEINGATAVASFNPEFNTGVQGAACAEFAVTTTLAVASASALQISSTSALTIAAWVLLTTLTSDTFYIAGKISTVDGGTIEYALRYNNFTFFPGAWGFSIGTSAVSIGVPFPVDSNDTFTIPVIGKWYHLVGIWQPIPSPIGLLYVNGRPYAYKDNILLTSISPANAKFAVGGGVSSINALNKTGNMRVCNVGLWNRALKDSEIGDLYNNGNMLTYPLNQLT